MIGRRVADNVQYPDLQPGDYSKQLHAEHSPPCPHCQDPPWWMLCTPNGHIGSLSPKCHTITEHPDGTITVEPSILLTRAHGGELYHGFLRAGVWEP